MKRRRGPAYQTRFEVARTARRVRSNPSPHHGKHIAASDMKSFTRGTIHEPETTFGNVKADVLALKSPR
jgi:hypothetical protein